jgi:ketosteroid isomerase-like protein
MDTSTTTTTADDVTAWVDRYEKAWRSNASVDIAALFTTDAEYLEEPYVTRWSGRDAIVDGWRSRWNWQQGGWSFTWRLVSLQGPVAVVSGVGTYTELGRFDNRWTLTFGSAGRCTRFHMVNTER